MTTTTFNPEQTTEARQRLMVAGGAALLVAGLVLVMFVLPAEYAVDPLGIGTRLGRLDLGVTAQDVSAALSEQNVVAPAGRIGAEPAPRGQVKEYAVRLITWRAMPRLK